VTAPRYFLDSLLSKVQSPGDLRLCIFIERSASARVRSGIAHIEPF